MANVKPSAFGAVITPSDTTILIGETAGGTAGRFTVAELPTAGTTAVDVIGGQIKGTVENGGIYVLEEEAAYPYTINSFSGRTLTGTGGTGTVAVKINGTNVTGLSAAVVNPTGVLTNATAANAVAVGDTVTMVPAGTLTDLSFTLKMTVT